MESAACEAVFVMSVLGGILESLKWKHLEILGVKKRRKVQLSKQHVYIKTEFQEIIISSFMAVNMART